MVCGSEFLSIAALCKSFFIDEKAKLLAVVIQDYLHWRQAYCAHYAGQCYKKRADSLNLVKNVKVVAFQKQQQSLTKNTRKRNNQSKVYHIQCQSLSNFHVHAQLENNNKYFLNVALQNAFLSQKVWQN